MNLYQKMNSDFKRMVARCALDDNSKQTLLRLADDMQREHEQKIQDNQNGFLIMQEDLK